MADDINISYSYQNGGTAPAETPAPAPANTQQSLYAFVDCERVNLQNGGVLLIHKHSDKQMVVAAEVSVALHSCAIFRTLDEHVEVLTSTVPQLAGQQADVTQVLAMIRDAGLMTSAADVCQRLQQAVPAATLAPTRVFIITCDRPAAVQRLLQSMMMAGNLTSHEALFLVDDSRNTENAAINRELVEKFNLSSPRDMHYIGAEAQIEMLNRLISELPGKEEGIRFLIDRERWTHHKSYGLTRTFCLLLSVDKRAIVMDDDVICASIASPYSKDGVIFGDIGREIEFYSSEQNILARTSKTDTNPLTGHAECLGLNMSDAIEKLGLGTLTEQALDGANAAYLSQWNANSPVLVTQSGTIGDPGTPTTDWVFSVDKESARRMLASPGGLEGALTNRHYWLGQPRPTFSKMAVISQVTGLDNTHLLPPYFPVFRGEDYLFGAMVEFLHPQSTVLEYDWSVPHFPVDQRTGKADTQPGNGKGGINPSKFITDRTTYHKGISPETHLKKLALLVEELAETADSDLMSIFRAEVAENQSAQITQLNAKLVDDIPRTDAWREHLQQCLNNVAQAVNEPAKLEDIPGIMNNYSSEQILTSFHAYAGSFAIALTGWPDIRRAAKTVSDKLFEDGELAP
ncbi:MAG: hypothetical protein V7746_12395 [Halioglobus sp.]